MERCIFSALAITTLNVSGERLSSSRHFTKINLNPMQHCLLQFEGVPGDCTAVSLSQGKLGFEGLEAPKSTSPGVYFPESSSSTV